MSRPGDVSIDELAVVYGWMQRLSTDEATAEEWTLEALRRYHRHQYPEWLRRCNVLLRLQYLTARVVLERRRLI
jgi:hypothetical protein